VRCGSDGAHPMRVEPRGNITSWNRNGFASHSPRPRSFMFHYRILRLLFSEAEPRFVHKLYTKSGAMWRPNAFCCVLYANCTQSVAPSFYERTYCVYLSVGS